MFLPLLNVPLNQSTSCVFAHFAKSLPLIEVLADDFCIDGLVVKIFYLFSKIGEISSSMKSLKNDNEIEMHLFRYKTWKY